MIWLLIFHGIEPIRSMLTFKFATTSRKVSDKPRYLSSSFLEIHNSSVLFNVFLVLTNLDTSPQVSKNALFFRAF